jgi:hypothetical protein
MMPLINPPSSPPPLNCLYSSLSMARVDFMNDNSIRAYSLTGHGISRGCHLNSFAYLMSRIIRVVPAGDRETRGAASKSYEGFSNATATS